MADDKGPVVGNGDCAGASSYFSVCAAGPGKRESSAARSSSAEKKGGVKSKAPDPCTVTRMSPQPPAGSSLWEGHKPGDGAIYRRMCVYDVAPEIVAVGGLPARTFWSKAAPPARAVDPAVLAQQAVDRMKLSGPAIGIVPKAGGKGLVGLPVWMWTTKGPETYGPNTATASAGAVTVTATAKVSQIVWDMGDGHSVTCTSAGTPYKASYGKQSSPDCGYRYRYSSKDEPGEKYPVTATSTWSIGWRGAGQTGQLTQTRESQTQVSIGQLKVLN